jgi:hypothetical protein
MKSSLSTSRPFPEVTTFMSDQLQVQVQVRRRRLREAPVGMRTSPNPAVAAPPIRLAGRTAAPNTSLFYYSSLEADSHLPEVQGIIRDAIRRGTIRVQPVPGSVNRVRISQVETSISADEAKS